MTNATDDSNDLTGSGGKDYSFEEEAEAARMRDYQNKVDLDRLNPMWLSEMSEDDRERKDIFYLTILPILAFRMDDGENQPSLPEHLRLERREAYKIRVGPIRKPMRERVSDPPEWIDHFASPKFNAQRILDEFEKKPIAYVTKLAAFVFYERAQTISHKMWRFCPEFYWIALATCNLEAARNHLRRQEEDRLQKSDSQSFLEWARRPTDDALPSAKDFTYETKSTVQRASEANSYPEFCSTYKTKLGDWLSLKLSLSEPSHGDEASLDKLHALMNDSPQSSSSGSQEGAEDDLAPQTDSVVEKDSFRKSALQVDSMEGQIRLAARFYLQKFFSMAGKRLGKQLRGENVNVEDLKCEERWSDISHLAVPAHPFNQEAKILISDNVWSVYKEGPAYHRGEEYESPFVDRYKIISRNVGTFCELLGCPDISRDPADSISNLRKYISNRMNHTTILYREIRTLEEKRLEQQRIITILLFRHVLESLPGPKSTKGSQTQKWEAFWQEAWGKGTKDPKHPLFPVREKYKRKGMKGADADKKIKAVGSELYSTLSTAIHQHNEGEITLSRTQHSPDEADILLALIPDNFRLKDADWNEARKRLGVENDEI